MNGKVEVGDGGRKTQHSRKSVSIWHHWTHTSEEKEIPQVARARIHLALIFPCAAILLHILHHATRAAHTVSLLPTSTIKRLRPSSRMKSCQENVSIHPHMTKKSLAGKDKFRCHLASTEVPHNNFHFSFFLRSPHLVPRREEPGLLPRAD